MLCHLHAAGTETLSFWWHWKCIIESIFAAIWLELADTVRYMNSIYPVLKKMTILLTDTVYINNTAHRAILKRHR